MFWTTNYLIWGVLFCVPYLGLAFFGPNYTLSIFNSKNITFPKKFFHITRISLEPYEGAMHFRWADILCQNWSWYQATALSSRLFSRRLSESRSPLQYLAARCGTKIFLLRCVGIFFIPETRILLQGAQWYYLGLFRMVLTPDLYIQNVKTFLPILLWRHQRRWCGIRRFQCMRLRCGALVLQLWQRSRLNIEFSQTRKERKNKFTWLTYTYIHYLGWTNWAEEDPANSFAL